VSPQSPPFLFESTSGLCVQMNANGSLRRIDQRLGPGGSRLVLELG